MRNNFRLMLLSMATLGFFSCSDKLTDDIKNGGGDIGGETGYLSFRIKSADTGGMTRTAWEDDDDNHHFNEGAGAYGNFAAEHAIVNDVQANRVFFFDKDGKYHSSALLTLEKAENGHDGHPNGSYGNMENVYSTTVKKTSDRGVPIWPNQCLIVLNGRPSRLNALTVLAQENKLTTETIKTDLDGFLAWVNDDLRETDAAGEGETLGLYKFGDLYYFTMTNSVFMDKDENEKDKISDATQIKEGMMKKTRDEAAADPITVYVERIMSKVEVSFTGYDGANGGTAQFGEKTNGFLYTFKDQVEGNLATWMNDATEEYQSKVTLKGLITNWTINAVEYQTKLFKQIDNTWTTTGTQQKPFNDWNDAGHHRSYWAIDPHYEFDQDLYPTQFRTSFDELKRSVYPYQSDWAYGKSEAEEGGNDIFHDYKYALDYKSFNAVSNKRAYKYCLENTFGLEDNDDKGYKHMIMGSHVLVQARLLTKDEADSYEKNELDFDEISDKYYYSDCYYNKDSYIGSRVSRINQTFGENYVGDLTIPNLKMFDDKDDLKDYTLGNIAGGLWVKRNNKYKKVVIVANDENNEIAATDVFNIAPAYVKNGDGKVTIALNSNGETKEDGEDAEYAYNVKNVGENGGKVNLYYVKQNFVDNNGQPFDKVYNEKGEETDEDNIVQFTRNQLVSLIYKIAGTADCFKGGRMYYTIPIQHHLAGTAVNEEGAKTGEYEYKYTGLKTADYGVVRNHWYKFTVNQILKPGIPVHNPDQPIIPNYDDEDRYLGLQIVILPWHVVNNGNVTLGQ